MNDYIQVQNLLDQLIREGKSKAEIVWEVAKACLGWPYVFGAWGEFCTPANRRRRYSINHPTIKTKCKNFNGTASCMGCEWFPNGVNVRCYDCRGFTDWCLKQVGIDLNGEGATSQWASEENWDSKGVVADLPVNTLVCLFVKSGSKMKHTGFGYNGATMECSSGVQYFCPMKKKWTHYAVPRGLYNSPPDPMPDPGHAIVTGKNVALRQGPSTGTAVMIRILTGTIVDLAEIDGWTYVKYGNKYGFMMNEFIEVGTNSVKVTGKNVAVRQGTNTDSKVLARIKTGTVVPRSSIPEGWSYISYNGKKGFMMDEYIRKG